MAFEDMSDQAREEFIEMMVEATRTGQSNTEALIRYRLEHTKAGKTVTALGNAAGTSAKGLKDSAKAVAGSTGNFNDLTEVMTGTIKAVSGLLGKIPFIGGMIESLGDAGAELAGFAVGQVQVGFDSFQQLSRAGMIGAGGVQELADNLKEVGVPLSTYTKLLTENAQTLSYFSSSATAGGKTFTTLMDRMAGDQGKMLRNLGYSVDEIGQTAINYQELQQRMGIQQQLTQQQLEMSTNRYAKELDLVSRLTGQNREEIQKQRMEQLRDSRFSAFISTLDKDSRERMLAQAQVADSMSAEAGKIFRAAATGYIKGDAEQRALVSGTYKTFRDWSQRTLNGSVNTGDEINKVANSMKVAVDKFGAIGAVLGDEGPYTNFAEMLKLSNIKSKDLLDVIAKQTKALNEPTKATDDLTTAMQKLQNTSATMSGFFIATPAATTAIKEFATALDKTIQYIDEKIGGAPSLTGNNYNTKLSDQYKVKHTADAAVERLAEHKTRLEKRGGSAGDIAKVEAELAVANKEKSKSDAALAALKADKVGMALANAKEALRWKEVRLKEYKKWKAEAELALNTESSLLDLVGIRESKLASLTDSVASFERQVNEQEKIITNLSAAKTTLAAAKGGAPVRAATGNDLAEVQNQLRDVIAKANSDGTINEIERTQINEQTEKLNQLIRIMEKISGKMDEQTRAQIDTAKATAKTAQAS
jgi:hypothetical protein